MSGKAAKGVFLKGDVRRDDLEQRFLAQHSGAMLHTKQCCKAVLCNITLSPKSSKIVETKRKERIKRKRNEKERRTRKKKNNCCTPSFSNSYFGEVETSFHTKGPFGDNVIKNPAGKTLEYI